MQTLEFTPEELDVLREVLRHYTKEMEVEVLHTDTHDFKAMLKHRRDVLEQILARLSAIPAHG